LPPVAYVCVNTRRRRRSRRRRPTSDGDGQVLAALPLLSRELSVKDTTRSVVDRPAYDAVGGACAGVHAGREDREYPLSVRCAVLRPGSAGAAAPWPQARSRPTQTAWCRRRREPSLARRSFTAGAVGTRRGREGVVVASVLILQRCIGVRGRLRHVQIRTARSGCVADRRRAHRVLDGVCRPCRRGRSRTAPQARPPGQRADVDVVAGRAAPWDSACRNRGNGVGAATC
jgi:hypothetical protein